MSNAVHSSNVALEAHRGARAARPWIERAARLGYLARGVLYLTIGTFAFLEASGSSSGETLDATGALRQIHAGSFGKALIVALIVGLAGYALWLLVQGTLDPEREIQSARWPIVRRVALLGRSAIHVGLAVRGVGLLMGDADGQGESAKSLTGEVMRVSPLGVIAVFLVGAGIVAFAVGEVRHAWRDDHLERLDSRVQGSWRTAVSAIARLGTTARAVVFALIGGYLLFAAAEHDPSEARGFGSALASLHHWWLGWALLGAAGIGLAAYGAFQVIQARHRRIEAC